MIVKGFDPIEDPEVRLLLLGTMPGRKSLEIVQYYADPSNDFWKIMQKLLGVEHDRAYEERIACLKRARIALWDVIQECERTGSTDQGIRRESARPNDIPALLRRCQAIRTLAFNGQAAECYFDSLGLQERVAGQRELRRVLLPSSSRNYTIPRATKVTLWRERLELLWPQAGAIRGVRASGNRAPVPESRCPLRGACSRFTAGRSGRHN